MGTIALKLLVVALFAWLYQAGGREGTPGGKAVRRYVGTGLMIASLYLFADDLNLVRAIVIPLFVGTALLGYGGDDTEEKIIRRLAFASMFAAYALLLGIAFGNPWLGAIQAFLAVFASLVFGLLNPTKAAYEETLIGALSVICLPFIV